MDEDPFKVTDVIIPTEDEIYFTRLTKTGVVQKCRMQAGMAIVVENLGTVKDFATKAISRFSMMTEAEIFSLDTCSLTHIEMTVLRFLNTCSPDEILDRIIGKPKQYNENVNVSATLEDVLKGVPQQGAKNVKDIYEEDGQV